MLVARMNCPMYILTDLNKKAIVLVILFSFIHISTLAIVQVDELFYTIFMECEFHIQTLSFLYEIFTTATVISSLFTPQEAAVQSEPML